VRTEQSQSAASPHAAAARLRAHVEMLAGTIGERNLWQYGALERAAQYISTQLTASGYTARRQTFELAKLPLSNVEGVLEGTSRAGEIVVVGAHYDSVAGCPGANDNATGVAAVLDLAQRFSRRPQPRTIHFVAFDADGQARPDWADAFARRSADALRMTTEDAAAHDWIALVRRLAPQLGSRRPHAIAAVVVRTR